MASDHTDSNTTDGLPEADVALEWLSTMMLIRRFEERAGEMYTRAKVGGFLHLCIGEEASVVGTVRAMRDSDYIFSTYREHGQAIARGTEPNRVMAELFGREDGVSRGRGGSMHLFDMERRFMGGYGIVGGNLPIAAGAALTSDYLKTEDVTVCTFGDGASNQGTFGETMNFAALWDLPIVFVVVNNQFGMGTSLARHSAVTDLKLKAEGFGIPGVSCDGMNVVDVYNTLGTALERARTERQATLVELITYRFRGHSMADPEEYRTPKEVDRWRERDPIVTFSARVIEAGYASEEKLNQLDHDAIVRVDEAVEFADASPFPSPESLYDDVYVLGDQVKGWYSIDTYDGGVRKGEDSGAHN